MIFEDDIGYDTTLQCRVCGKTYCLYDYTDTEEGLTNVCPNCFYDGRFYGSRGNDPDFDSDADDWDDDWAEGDDDDDDCN